MKKLRRDDRIRLFAMGVNQFEGRNKSDDVVLDHDSDYFIYMKNVNFRNGNIIEGRYLGNLDSNSPLIDNQCKIAKSDGDKFFIDGDKIVRTARMVAVNNKTNVIIIIQQQ